MSPRRPLHGLVDLSDYFSRVPTLLILGLGFLSACLVARARGGVWVGVGFFLLVLFDGGMLVALPRFARSFGPPQLPWLSLMALRLALSHGAAWGLGAWSLPVDGAEFTTVQWLSFSPSTPNFGFAYRTHHNEGAPPVELGQTVGARRDRDHR